LVIQKLQPRFRQESKTRPQVNHTQGSHAYDKIDN